MPLVRSTTSIPMALSTSAAVKHFGALPVPPEGKGALEAAPDATYCDTWLESAAAPPAPQPASAAAARVAMAIVGRMT
jgi:hypothetical protein